MSITVDASTGATSKTTKADTRRSFTGATERDREAQQAYEAGQAGQDWPHSPDADPTIREAHRAGLDEHAASRRGRLYASGRGVANDTVRRLRATAARAPRQVRRSTPLGGGSWSTVGIGLGVLGVIGLYLLLTHSTLTAKVTSGVLAAVNWFVAPKPLPI